MMRVRRKRPPMRVATTPPAARPTTAPSAPHGGLETAIISGARIDRWFRALVRLFFGVTFAVGVVGNLVTVDLTTLPLDDRVWTWLAGILPMLLAAAIYQLVVQVCQIGARRRYGIHRTYLLFIALSVVPSCWTFGRVIVHLTDPSLVRLLCLAPLPVILTAVDVLQDRVFVRG